MTKTYTKTNPLNDEQLAELDRLHAAAKMPARLYAITCPREAWEGINVYEVDTGGEPHWFALCLTRERAEYTEAALNAYPALRQRLAEAERERDELRRTIDFLREENKGLVNTIRGLDKDALCDWHDGLGGEEYLAEWLAARDAQQRREGAAEWLEKFLVEWDTDATRDLVSIWDIRQASQRLREGK